MHGAVLAGGAGRRVGGDKAMLRFEGRRLIEYPLAALQAAGLTAFVVCRPETALPPLEVPVVHDAGEIRHPLAGVLAALDHAGGPVVVVATDMPDLPPQLLRRLAGADPARGAVVASVRGAIEPLCARYAPAVRDALARALAAQAPLRQAVAELSPLEVPTDAAAVRNLNTLGELRT